MASEGNSRNRVLLSFLPQSLAQRLNTRFTRYSTERVAIPLLPTTRKRQLFLSFSFRACAFDLSRFRETMMVVSCRSRDGREMVERRGSDDTRLSTRCKNGSKTRR